ncbi:MAG: DUF4249 domain-containing protein [Crocinitomicaceae bacterium]
MKQELMIISLILFFFSCEKVIEVPLDEASQQIVVEGTLYDQPDESVVKLSRTGSVYDDSGFEKISGAQVTVTDDQGNTYNFLEDGNQAGSYRNSSFLTQPNYTYALTIYVDDDTLTAKSSTKGSVVLDSLTYIPQYGGFGTEDTTFLVFYNFSDEAAQENYYRMIPYVNDERSDFLYLQNDQLFNGKTIRAPFFAESIEAGDTILARLISMDKENYKYFNTLSNNDGGAFSPTPANPVSNIEGGALGYFGAYITDNDTIIIPE